MKLGRDTIHWNNYLIEGDSQDLHLSDFLSLNGRVSRSNFRALSFLAFGLAICILLLPGLLGVELQQKHGIDVETTMDASGILIYIVSYTILTLLLLLMAIKRMRDTGNSPWKLLIPLFNLKALYFDVSK
ncbi:MAG: DUF805 domain-containing protein [Saprospiraceae bacterium]